MLIGDNGAVSIVNETRNLIAGRTIGSILNKNANWRSWMLMRNIGKYGLFQEPLYPEIGAVYNPYEKIFVTPTSTSWVNGLIGYNNGIFGINTEDTGENNGQGGFYETSFVLSNDMEGLLAKRDFLSKDAFFYELQDALKNGGAYSGEYNKIIYSSNGAKSRGGEGALRRTLFNVETYLRNAEIRKQRAQEPFYEITKLLNNGGYEHQVYAEIGSGGRVPNSNESYSTGGYNSTISVFDLDVSKIDQDNSLLDRTNVLFSEGKIGSLINRFYITNNEELKKTYTKSDELLTSINGIYGISRGRNLVKKGYKGNDDTYDNPYCRVWTANHQYSTLKDRIRPFSDENGGLLSVEGTQKTLYENERPNGGAARLGTMTVLNNNGFVNITPYNNKDYKDGIKRCMFSIENLAWRDVVSLTDDQKGPNGGRIMWFPPYNLSFSENINTRWNNSTFIGRGEDIYTYTNTERGGTLDFTLLIDHPSVVNQWGQLAAGVKEEEDDLLRFFAGCSMEFNVNNKEKGRTETVKAKSSEPVETAEDPEIKFIVFFPNNFTGHDYSTSAADIRNAIEYLAYGISGSTQIANDGYETSSNGSTLKEEYRQKGKDKNGNEVWWKYRVDKKYSTQQLDPSNYSDSRGFSLNKRTDDSIEKIRGVIDRSFSENYLYSFEEAANAIYKRSNSGETGMLRNILERGNYEIAGIKVDGHATTQGQSTTSQREVAKRRAQFIKEWLVSTLGVQAEDVGIDAHVDPVDDNDVSSFNSKLGRRTEVTIQFRTVEYTTEKAETNTTEDGSKEPESKENKDKYLDTSYGNEYLYFKELKAENPLVFSKVVEKVKYFQPAFHSISPEGFNARLTFLHQCTRQGPTNVDSAAANLSFGRAPYCVLRLGDFYNTKILIEAISINYDEAPWDMNPEGVGMQPMLAKVSLTFKFVGGTDISGPIERLQNAVSFNYYSNTSIYDGRADYRKAFVTTVNENGNDVHNKPVTQIVS